MRRKGSNVKRVEVQISKQGNYALAELDSLENVAIETFKIKKPLIYFKTIIRAVIKGISAKKGKEKMTKDMNGLASFFVRISTDIAVDITENADLRTSRFFPAKAYLREVHLDEGSYEITINYYGKNNQVLYSDKKGMITLKAGKLNLLESAYLN
jgi:hypothetical protein